MESRAQGIRIGLSQKTPRLGSGKLDMNIFIKDRMAQVGLEISRYLSKPIVLWEDVFKRLRFSFQNLNYCNGPTVTLFHERYQLLS